MTRERAANRQSDEALAAVLILHHAAPPEPRPVPAPGPEAPQFPESAAGVLGEVAAIAAALGRLGRPHRVAAVRDLADVASLLAGSPERIVFNLVEDFAAGTDDASLVPAFVRAHGKECVGGDWPCLALTTDKWQTRAILEAAGLPVARGVLVPVGGRFEPRRLPAGRVIVKPVASDASEGIDEDAVGPRDGPGVRRAIRRVHEQFAQAALVEEYVAGREVNVSLWERAGKVAALPLAEIDFEDYGRARPHIVGYRAKWVPGTPQYHGLGRVLPARLPAGTAARLRRLAEAAWRATGCRDYARVDLRLRRDGTPVILEVNINPDLSLDAGFAAALRAGRVPYHRFVAAMVGNAAARLAAREAARRADAPAPRRGPGTARPGAPVRYSEPRDREAVLRLLADTGFFRPDELDVAAEVLDEALESGPAGHYQSFVVEDEGAVAGWVCCGPVPCSLGAWDVYWLGVAPDRQGRGLGKALVRHAEQLIRARGGYLSVIETSGNPHYTPTRAFYLGSGYYEAARLSDFYAPGDDRIIYLKRLDG